MTLWRLIAAMLALLLASSAAQAQDDNATVVAPDSSYGRYNLDDYIGALPANSEKIIEERRVLDTADASVRVFRLYKPVPMHYHAKSDTHQGPSD